VSTSQSRAKKADKATSTTLRVHCGTGSLGHSKFDLIEADLAFKIARARSCSQNVANCLVEPGAE